MTFVEFLMENYIYILVVLIILIVGVIGFLVDSKNKEKQQVVKGDSASNGNSVSAAISNGTNNVDGAQVNVGDVSNTVSNAAVQSVQQQMVNSAVNDGQSTQVVTEQPQVGNVMLNQVVPENVSDISANVASSVGTPLNDGVGMVGGQNVQPDMSNVVTSQVPVQNINNGVGMTNTPGMVNEMYNVQNIQPDMSNVSASSISVENTNNNVGLANSSGMVNGINGVSGVQPQMSSVMVDPIPVQNGMAGVQNIQPDMSNIIVNPQPVEKVNNIGMTSVTNVGNEIVGMQVGQSGVQNMAVNSNSSGIVNVAPVVTNGSNVTPEIVVGQNIQPQMTSINQLENIPNGNVQNTDVVGQMGNTENIPNNNAVFTSDSSQPFDISSMFANNQ